MTSLTFTSTNLSRREWALNSRIEEIEEIEVIEEHRD